MELAHHHRHCRVLRQLTAVRACRHTRTTYIVAAFHAVGRWRDPQRFQRGHRLLLEVEWWGLLHVQMDLLLLDGRVVVDRLLAAAAAVATTVPSCSCPMPLGKPSSLTWN